MSGVTPRFARRFRFLRLLRLSLALGAAYDLAFALLLVAAPARVGAALGVSVPDERYFVWTLAVLLGMVGGLLLFAAHDPRRYSAIILVAILGRLAGSGALAFAALAGPELAGLYAAAALEFTFGSLHAILWLPVYS